MQPTSFNTFSVEPIGTTTPTVIAKARGVSVRVQVANVGAVVIFVAQDVNDLVPEPSVNSYRILPGEQHVLVLAPKQSLYAVATGTGSSVSVTSSEVTIGERQAG